MIIHGVIFAVPGFQIIDYRLVFPNPFMNLKNLSVVSLFAADMSVCIYHIYHVIKHGMEAENGKK